MAKSAYTKVAIAAFLTMLMMVFATSAYGLFIDPILASFLEDGVQANVSSVSSVVSIISFMGVLTNPFWGKKIEDWGAKRVMILAGVIVSAAFVMMALAPNPLFLNLGALVAGTIYMPAFATLPMVLVNKWFVEKRGLITGIVVAASGVGGTILGFLVPSLLQFLTWRHLFIGFALIILSTMLICAFFLVENEPADLGLQPYGAKAVTARDGAGKDSPATGIPFQTAIKSSEFIMAFLGMFLFGMATTFLNHMSPHFNQVFMDQGYSQMLAFNMSGALYSVYTIASIPAKIGIGGVTDYIGVKNALYVVVLSYLASMVIFLSSGQIFLLALGAVLMAIGLVALGVLSPEIVSALYGSRDYARIYSVYAMSGSLAMAVGNLGWGLIRDLTGNYQVGFYIAIVFSLISLVLFSISLTRGQKKLVHYTQKGV